MKAAGDADGLDRGGLGKRCRQDQAGTMPPQGRGIGRLPLQRRDVLGRPTGGVDENHLLVALEHHAHVARGFDDERLQTQGPTIRLKLGDGAGAPNIEGDQQRSQAVQHDGAGGHLDQRGRIENICN